MDEKQNGSKIPDGEVVELPKYVTPIEKVPVDVRIHAEAVHEIGSGRGFLKLQFHTESTDFTAFIPGDVAPKFAHDLQIKANQASIAKPPGSGGIVIP